MGFLPLAVKPRAASPLSVFTKEEHQLASNDEIGVLYYQNTTDPFPDLVQVQNKPSVATARLLLVAAAALYGTNFACVKLLGGTAMPVEVSSMLRFGMASVATLPWLLSDSNDFFASEDWKAIQAGLVVGGWNAIGYISQAVGLETTLASKSAFMCSLAVVVVPILDYMTGKNLSRKEICGIIMALVGVGFLELGGDAQSLLDLNIGDAISMLQPLAFGMGFWKMEETMRNYPNQANRSTAAQLLAVFLSAGIYCGYSQPDISGLAESLSQPWIWAGLFWTGCITTALTVYMETVALKTLSAAETTLIFSTEPVWGSLTAALLLGETFGLSAYTGGGLILAGCILSNLELPKKD